MSEWKEYKLKDICTLINGRAYLLPELQDSGKYKILRVGNLTGKTEWFYSDMELPEDKYCFEGDLLFAWACTFGPYIWQGKKTIYHYHIWKMILQDEIIDKKYFYYFLKNYISFLESQTNGSVMLHVTKGTMENQIIPLPSKSTQHRIADILSSLDDKIETNRAINARLEELAAAIFKSWFIDFVSSNEETTIEEYLTPKRGKNLLTKDAIEGDVPVVAGGLEPSCYHNVANTQSPVITISASGANAGFVKIWSRPVWSADSSYIDTTITPFVYFWYNLLKYRQKEIYKAQTGCAQPHIYPYHISALSIKKLDISKVEKFNLLVTSLYEGIENNNKEIIRLATLRDTLLPRLMSGELIPE